MNLLFLCTLSLLLFAPNMFGSDLRKRIDTIMAPESIMTSGKFFTDYFDTDTDSDTVYRASKEISEDLYQKALNHDLDAMWQLAEKTDEAVDIDTIVPMYWLSKIAQTIVVHPTGQDMVQLRKRAEEKLNIIAQQLQLLNIKVHEGIELRKRKKQLDRVDALRAELHNKKQKLDTEQAWSMFKSQ